MGRLYGQAWKIESFEGWKIKETNTRLVRRTKIYDCSKDMH